MLVFLPTLAVLAGLYMKKSAFAAIGLYHLGMIVVLLHSSNRSLFKKAFSGWKTPAGAIMIIAACSAGLFCYLLRDWVFKEGLDFTAVLGSFGLTKQNWLFFCLYFSTVNPILEELFWRAFYSKEAKEDSFPLLTLQDAGFAFYHLLVLYFFLKPLFLVPVFVSLVIAAAIWRYLYRRYGGLLICIISHIAADVGIVTAAALLMK